MSKTKMNCVVCCFTALLFVLAPAPWVNSLAESSTPTHPALLLGTAWYPKQWPESRWETDLTLMEQAGIHMVRVDEFAWSRMEPPEGQYDLDWLDRAIAAALFVIINFSHTEQTIPLSGPMRDVLEGGEKTSLRPPVYGLAVLSPLIRALDSRSIRGD